MSFLSVHTTSSEGRNGPADQAQANAKEVASQREETACEGAGRARVRMREQVEERFAQLGERVRSSASDVR
jgi:hypothetical protein